MSMHMYMMAIVLIFAIYKAFFVILDSGVSSTIIHKVVALAVFVSAAILLFQRDTYLPFLGRMAIPSSVLKESAHPAHANTEVTLQLPRVSNGTKVVYWGAKPASKVQKTPWAAYDDFSNAGVAVVVDGKAILRFNCPSKYTVGAFKTLNRHIHYRVYDQRGMLGPIQTRFVNC